MSSTRNKNTPGNYDLEQQYYKKQTEYKTYIHSQYGKPQQTHFPGNGLLQGRVAPTELSHNPCDLESFLYGIGTTNLVNPQAKPVAQIYEIESLNVMKKLPVILPEPLVIDGHQRPRPM
jgi:hypothetical protein